MRKKLAYVFFLGSIIFISMGAYFLTRQTKSWKTSEYIKHRHIDLNGVEQAGTYLTDITVTNDKSDLGLGMCIVGASLALAASILLASVKDEKT